MEGSGYGSNLLNITDPAGGRVVVEPFPSPCPSLATLSYKPDSPLLYVQTLQFLAQIFRKIEPLLTLIPLHPQTHNQAKTGENGQGGTGDNGCRGQGSGCKGELVRQ